MDRFNSGMIRTLEIVGATLLAICLLAGCGTKTDEQPGENEENIAEVLSDGTPVYGFYLTYFESTGAMDSALEARIFAAKLSMCEKELGEISEEKAALYAEKAAERLEYLKNSPSETPESVCKRAYGISLDQFKEIFAGSRRIEELYETLSSRYAATDSEVSVYLRENYGGSDNMCFLRVGFDGGTLPVLPDGIKPAGYPEDISGAADFGLLLEDIADAIGDSDGMLALIEANAGSGDDSVVMLRELLEKADTDEKEKLIKVTGDRIKGVGDVCVISGQDYYEILYCIGFVPDDPSLAEDAKKAIAERKTDDAVNSYVNGLLEKVS